jgi:hypothetical protein
MRILIFAMTLVLGVACSNGTSPNAPNLTSFDYNETKVIQPGELPYDSVRVDAGQLQVERRYAGNLCGSTLDGGVSASGAELTLRVSQNPIAACGEVSGLITWRGTVQLLPGGWHLRVTEFNATTPSGAVVLDRAVTVPGR